MIEEHLLIEGPLPLAHEYVGLEEVADGIWSLHYYGVLLARFDERDFKLRA